MTRLLILAPVLLVTAWTGPWTCKVYTLPDGGTTTINPNPGGGSPTGGQTGTVANTVAITYTTDGGQSGTAPGADGGVTIGSAAAFASDFVYMSNSGDGTISRILIPASGPPYEQARYYCIVPVDNHGVEPCTGSGKTDSNGRCVAGERDIWQVVTDQLNLGNGGGNSPSRTLVDRSGNVWVALRAPGCGAGNFCAWQAGATEIINVSDNIGQCETRCHQRAGLVAGQHFTEGVPLQLAGGGTRTLIPPTLIAPGSSYAQQYHCTDANHDQTGNDEDDPVNYDDCIKFSIPLGEPNPDPNADPNRLTGGTSFSRAAAMSPHCNAATSQCDVWIGQWNGAAEIDLAYGGAGNGSNTPYDVNKVMPTGISPYGNTVDCAGILWEGSVGSGNLAALTTITYTDPVTGKQIPPYTNITQAPGMPGYVPNYSGCGQYGVGSDVQQRIWIAAWQYGNRACSFDAKTYLKDYIAVENGGLAAIPGSDIAAAWKSYDLNPSTGNNGYSRGINTDKYNNVALGVWCNNGSGGGAESFNPDKAGQVPCWTGTGGWCQNGTLNWFSQWPGQSCNIGVDFDQENDVWAGNYYGSATRFSGATGQQMINIPLGSNVYSYSDFTGYALHNVTLATALVHQAFDGCASEPEFTEWQTLSYTANVPPGTDIQIQAQVSNSLDPAALSAIAPTTLCESVASGKCQNPIDLQKPSTWDPPQTAQLSGGQYLVVDAILVPKVCALAGSQGAAATPTLYGFGVAKSCPGN